MPEGFSAGEGVLGAAVHDNPQVQPEPSQEAPRGWTWNRQARNWQPMVRGRIVWTGHADAPPDAGDDFIPDPVQDTGGFAGSTPDPGPSWADDPAPPADKFEPSAQDRRDIKALIALVYTVPAESLPLIDPYCFGALQERETATGVIDAVSDIVAASPRVAKWAVSASGLMPWIKLAYALKPIGINILHHHITHRVEVEVDRENMSMTVTENNWSQYSAA